MNKDIINSINNIVWLIPSKKLRNSVRDLLIEHYSIKDKLESLDKLKQLDID